jgi:hypothetical protein
MSGSDDAEIACNIISKPALHFIEARIPLEYVAHINAYIDRVRARSEDYSGELVGQIKQNRLSAQLKLDLDEDVPGNLATVIAQVGTQLVEFHGLAAHVIANDMWTIHSYQGDYNPLHDHGARTLVGLSSILYLKVPEAIAAKPDIESGHTPNLAMASGACDGFTQFQWGANGMMDTSLLRLPTQQYVKPEAGKLLVFPNWLLHRVEPFFGEGERRTLSCNLDVHLSPGRDHP